MRCSTWTDRSDSLLVDEDADATEMAAVAPPNTNSAAAMVASLRMAPPFPAGPAVHGPGTRHDAFGLIDNVPGILRAPNAAAGATWKSPWVRDSASADSASQGTGPSTVGAFARMRNCTSLVKSRPCWLAARVVPRGGR